ncbi:flagellar hook-length control protein FliK [Massilia sp. SYSU DXS3249]
MNLTFNNTNGPAAQARPAAPAASDVAAPQGVDASAADARQPALDAGQPAPAQPALAFAQWLGLEQAAPQADGAAVVPDTEAAAEEQQASADTPLLGAMAMNLPLMPVAQTALAAVVAALPGVPGLPAAEEPAPAADGDAASLPVAASTQRPVAALPASSAASNTAAAPAALPAETLAAGNEAPQDGASFALERGAANTVGMAALAPGNAQRTADTVTLSGPPTAWRQTLQEALGDRLQLQLGKNAEQATIRLEPPMLGRVEIAIRHSAGSLEVHISATHGEVLRQLQAVGENLRNDLAQRQFTDVAVNIAPAPRGGAARTNKLG